MKELQELINEWKQEAVELLLKSKTATNEQKEAGYYAASSRLTMCYTELELLLKRQPNSDTPPQLNKHDVIRGCQHELVLIKGKKDWFCWKCRKYEHELTGNLV